MSGGGKRDLVNECLEKTMIFMGGNTMLELGRDSLDFLCRSSLDVL